MLLTPGLASTEFGNNQLQVGNKNNIQDLTLAKTQGTTFVTYLITELRSLKILKRMNREYTFSPELLRMMLAEERQKFVEELGHGASWRKLNRIKKTVNQLNNLLDSENNLNGSDVSDNRWHNENRGRNNENDPR